MKYKSFYALKMDDMPMDDGSAGESKSTPDGQFEAIVSVFGNPDAWGDVVLPGAYTETLAEWQASGDPIPVLWSHRMDDPRFHIGVVLEAAELGPGDARVPDWCDQWVKDHGGLWVKGQIDTGADATEVAVVTRRLLVSRRVTQFSFCYNIQDAGWGTHDGRDVYELRRLDIFEVSPTLVGCNGLTELLGAKDHRGEPPSSTRDGVDSARVLADLLEQELALAS